MVPSAELLQRPVDNLARLQRVEAGMVGAEAASAIATDLVIRAAALAGRVDQLGAELEVLVARLGQRSSCSMNMVAGSTMSAMRAVSVMNCSWTHGEKVVSG